MLKINLSTALLALCTMLSVSPADARVYTSFADVAEKAIPGVVNIRTTSYKTSNDGVSDLYQFFLQGKIPRSQSSHAVGSGVVIDKEGRILTNHHVVAGADRIEVVLAESKQKLSAKVIGSDIKTDLALLQVTKARGLTPLTLGDSDSLRIGDVVLAIGNPFGYAHTVTTGIISAKGRVIGAGPYDNFLQTDAAIHPGNSGGPLLDVRGRVIGINTAVSSDGPGIGFAIPINMAKIVIRDLVKHGKVKRPWMGIVGQNILSDDEIGAGSEGVYGVIVANLIVGGPAHAAGIKIGDLVMGFGKAKVDDMNHLQRLMSMQAPADSIRVKIYRRGEGFRHLTINLSEVPRNDELPIEKDLF